MHPANQKGILMAASPLTLLLALQIIHATTPIDSADTNNHTEKNLLQQLAFNQKQEYKARDHTAQVYIKKTQQHETPNRNRTIKPHRYQQPIKNK